LDLKYKFAWYQLISFFLKVLIDELVFIDSNKVFLGKTQNLKKKNLTFLHHQVWSLFFLFLKKKL
jgi:hypothetical protein